MAFYRKISTTQAREFTQQDYEQLNGQITTKNGVESFTVGDYLFKDRTGLWVVKQAGYAGHWNALGLRRDDHGFEIQQPLSTIEVTQQIDGSYLLVGGQTMSQEEFEDHYSLAEGE